MRWRLLVQMLAAGALLAAPAAAQPPHREAERLASATALTCTFTTMATGTWKEGVAVAATRDVSLSLGFVNIDTQDGTADATSDGGKWHITVRVVGNYLNLMQMDPYGALYVTTVFNTETEDKRLLAVHTRHEYTPVQLPGFTSRPEQYYGSCVVQKGGAGS